MCLAEALNVQILQLHRLRNKWQRSITSMAGVQDLTLNCSSLRTVREVNETPSSLHAYVGISTVQHGSLLTGPCDCSGERSCDM